MIGRRAGSGRRSFARTWSSAQMTRWSVAILALALAYYFF